MKTRHFTVAVAVLLTLLVGYYLGLRLTLAEGAKKAFRGLRDTQLLASSVSVTTLDRLERGDVEGAKRLLATQISGYYRSDMIDASGNGAITRKYIEDLSSRSPVLKEMLSSP
jgi:hypothetical protein